jgi:hypothetical protein
MVAPGKKQRIAVFYLNVLLTHHGQRTGKTFVHVSGINAEELAGQS